MSGFSSKSFLLLSSRLVIAPEVQLLFVVKDFISTQEPITLAITQVKEWAPSQLPRLYHLKFYQQMIYCQFHSSQIRRHLLHQTEPRDD
jgi:hypothetical protein